MRLCDENQLLTGLKKEKFYPQKVEKLNVVLGKRSHAIKLSNAAVSSRKGTILFFF